MMHIFHQILSVIGALLILAAYWLLHRKRLESDGAPYLWMNLVGGLLLALVAIHDRRIGFILLETTWALIALLGLWRLR